MFVRKQYTVSDGSFFEIENYPEIAGEIFSASEKFAGVITLDKLNVFISYLRDHSVKKIWVLEHPQFVDDLIQFSSQLANVEALFAVCKSNHSFSLELEKYIREILAQ